MRGYPGPQGVAGTGGYPGAKAWAEDAAKLIASPPGMPAPVRGGSERSERSPMGLTMDSDDHNSY